MTSTQGPGNQSLTWDPDEGDWTIVVMNADGSAPVRTRAAVGAELPVLGDGALWLLTDNSAGRILRVTPAGK